ASPTFCRFAPAVSPASRRRSDGRTCRPCRRLEPIRSIFRPEDPLTRFRTEAPMPEYLSPGVYIEEIERGPRPIEGVSTSTAAFLGETERGPTTPRLVTSFNEYRRYFGDPFDPGKYMADALSGFFANGGHRAYICR